MAVLSCRQSLYGVGWVQIIKVDSGNQPTISLEPFLWNAAIISEYDEFLFRRNFLQ